MVLPILQTDTQTSEMLLPILQTDTQTGNMMVLIVLTSAFPSTHMDTLGLLDTLLLSESTQRELISARKTSHKHINKDPSEVHPHIYQLSTEVNRTKTGTQNLPGLKLVQSREFTSA